MFFVFIKYSLAFIAYGWTNPFAQDLFTQYIGASIIGFFLPSRLVSPINNILKSIPVIGHVIRLFEGILDDDELYYIVLDEGLSRYIYRFKIFIKSSLPVSAVPRIIAGYFFTYVIGFIALALLLVFFDMGFIRSVAGYTIELIQGVLF